MLYGYLLLGAALLAGSVKAYCGKKSSGAVSVFSDALLINALRMTLCAGIGFLLPIISGRGDALFPIGLTAFLPALSSGLATAWFVVSWVIVVKSNAYMMVDVFLMLGTAIPMTGSWILFNEKVRIIQWGGYLLLLAAVILLCQYSSKTKGRLSFQSVLLLLSSGLANGIVDFSQKIFVQYNSAVPISVFQFYNYLVSAVFLWTVLGISSKKQKPLCSIRSVWGYVVIMAIGLFLNGYFKTWAAVFLPSSLLYPLSQGAALIISAAMAAVFFREKLTLKSVIGIFVAFAGLYIINVL